MKLKSISIMAILCLMLSAFLFGMYFGRNFGNSTVDISQITNTTGNTQGTVPPVATVPTTSTAATTPSTTAPVTQTPTETQSVSTQPTTSGKVNINTADLATLMTLEGIGEVYAQRIIDYRNEHGPFTSIADIANVSGIGTKRFEAIMDDITVGE